MKRYKVRHYRSRIYNPVRGKVLKGILVAVIAVSLFAIGWFAYEPLMTAINEKNKEIIEQEPVPEKPQEPAYEPVEIEFLEKETVAVAVPEEFLYDSTSFYGFLKNLDKNVTAIVIDMKTKDGTVTYQSNQVSVLAAGAASETAVDLDALIRTARNLGLDVVARIYAFEDRTAPYNANDMAIRYESEEGILWLDDSVDNGGKPWLNPYSDTAQKYILDIVYDAVDSEVDAILLEGMRFPENEGMEYAYFGVTAEEVSKEEILLQFAKRVYSSVVTTDTDIIIGFDSFSRFSGSDIYGGDPFALSADGYAPEIDIDDFIGKKFSDDFYFKKLPGDITEVFVKIYENLGDTSGFKMIPILDFEGFTKEQTAGIFDFLEEKGATGYILLYNEAYFTGVPEEPEIPEEPANPTPVQPTAPVQPSVPEKPSEPEKEKEEEEEKKTETTTGNDGYERVEESPGIKDILPTD